MTFRVSLTGMDGTGKTTLIREIRKLHELDFSEVYSLRAPQFHEDPLLPFGPLSDLIEKLSVQGDLLAHPLLKALALFLSMTLSGDIEHFVCSTFKPKIYIGERQSLADTLAYSQFYIPILAQNRSNLSLRSQISDFFGPQNLALLEAWLKVVSRRIPEIPLNIDCLSEFMIRVCQGSQTQVIERLKVIYNANYPDLLIVLTSSPESIRSRLLEKKLNTPVQEIHEQESNLKMLQSALMQAAEALIKISPEMKLKILDTRNLTIPQSVEAIFSTISEVVKP